jgi:hypothetical protein
MSNKTRPANPKPVRTERSLNDIPRWLPPIVFALITVVLFRDFILGAGKLLGVDTLALSYFARNFYTQFVNAFHRFPLWEPLLYGGMPFIDGMHGDIFYPPSLALFFLSAEQMWGWKLVLHVFLAGAFMHLWLRELGVSRGSAMLGGIIFMMGADLVSLVFPGGDGKLFVSALAPLAFLLTERAVRLGRGRDYAAFSLGIALLLFTSHMQLAYFCVWGVTLYFGFRLAQRWRNGLGHRLGFASLAAFALAGLLGVGAAAVQFVPPLGYLREWSHRAAKTADARAGGYEYSTTYALHPEEIMSLVVPSFVGDNVQTETKSGQTYWGRNAFKINNEYAGLIGLILLPLLFLRRRRAEQDRDRDRLAWFFAGLAVLSLLYALGANTPLFHLFYLMPGVSLFRAPSLIIFLYGLSAATLAALAFDRALELGRDAADESKAARRALWIGVGVLGVLAVMASTGILISIWRSVFYSSIGVDKIAALATHMPDIHAGFWISFAIAAAVAGVWEGYARGWWSAHGALIGLCVIAFLDQYHVSRPFIHATVLMNEAADPVTFVADESIDYLKQRQAAGEVFRAFDLTGGYRNNVFAIHGIEQMAGHHGNEIGRYRELIGGDQPYNLQHSLSLLDLTNTEYLTATPDMQLPGYAEVFRGSRSLVLRKADILPRAYLVGTVEVVPDSLAVRRLLAQDFDFRGSAVLAAPLPAGVEVQAGPQGGAQWLERGANRQRIKVTSDRPALLMVLDNYYGAWQARVGERAVPILRANHTFRAVPIPAGEHEVTFTYDPDYLRGPAIASAVILLMLLVIAFGSPLRDRASGRGARA